MSTKRGQGQPHVSYMRLFESPRNGGGPQTNDKIERFQRALADGWPFNRFYTSERQRWAAVPAWIHQYNHHRPHRNRQSPAHQSLNQPGWSVQLAGARMGRAMVGQTTDWGGGSRLTSLPGFRMCLGQDRTDKAPRAMMHTAMTAMAIKYPLAVPRPAL